MYLLHNKTLVCLFTANDALLILIFSFRMRAKVAVFTLFSLLYSQKELTGH